MICEKCGKDILDCPCDFDYFEPILKNIKGNRCPGCEERVYSNGIHMCRVDDDRKRHDSTVCFKCYSNVHFIDNERFFIPDEGFKTRCECEVPDVK